jgi:hypothetical protein
MATKTKVPKLAISHNFSRTNVPVLLTQAQKVMTNNQRGVDDIPDSARDHGADTGRHYGVDRLVRSGDGRQQEGHRATQQRHPYARAGHDDACRIRGLANGDAAIIAASGFTPAPPRVHTAPQPRAQPAIDSVTQGLSGQALVQLTAIPKVVENRAESETNFGGLLT